MHKEHHRQAVSGQRDPAHSERERRQPIGEREWRRALRQLLALCIQQLLVLLSLFLPSGEVGQFPFIRFLELLAALGLVTARQPLVEITDNPSLRQQMLEVIHLLVLLRPPVEERQLVLRVWDAPGQHDLSHGSG